MQMNPPININFLYSTFDAMLLINFNTEVDYTLSIPVDNRILGASSSPIDR